MNKEEYKEDFISKLKSLSGCNYSYAEHEFLAWDNDGNGNILDYDDPEGEALECFQAMIQASI